jgi:hypothetical protein
MSDSSDENDDSEGLIRCICGFSDDDGFTVQCEKCNVWQHIACVAVDGEEKSLPEVYECEQCNTDPEAYNVLAWIYSLISRKLYLIPPDREVDRTSEVENARNHL